MSLKCHSLKCRLLSPYKFTINNLFLQLNEDTQWKRKEASRKIKAALEQNHDISKVIKFIVRLPEKESHQNHVIGTVSNYN